MYLEIKQGDTFYAQAQYCNALGQANDLTGITINAALFDGRNNQAQLLNSTVVDAANGMFEINPFNTQTLPVGRYLFVLSYTKDGVKVSSNPIGMHIVKQRSSTLKHAKINLYGGYTKFLIKSEALILTAQDFNALWDAAWDVQWTNN